MGRRRHRHRHCYRALCSDHRACVWYVFVCARLDVHVYGNSLAAFHTKTIFITINEIKKKKKSAADLR